MPTNSSKKTTSKSVHKFSGIRELVLSNANTNLAFAVSSDATGTANGGLVFTTGGLKSVAISGSSFVSAVVDNPHLRWLLNQSGNFGMFRVTRAKLMFVGNVGSTATGTLNLQGFKDALDAGGALSTAFVGGQNGKIFDLASSATKELSIQLPVDSSWKKVSGYLAIPGNTAPFVGAVGAFVNVNSVNDLCFSAFSYQVTGAPVSVVLGNFMVDYDVEFSHPENSQLNA